MGRGFEVQGPHQQLNTRTLVITRFLVTICRVHSTAAESVALHCQFERLNRSTTSTCSFSKRRRIHHQVNHLMSEHNCHLRHIRSALNQPQSHCIPEIMKSPSNGPTFRIERRWVLWLPSTTSDVVPQRTCYRPGFCSLMASDIIRSCRFAGLMAPKRSASPLR